MHNESNFSYITLGHLIIFFMELLVIEVFGHGPAFVEDTSLLPATIVRMWSLDWDTW